MSELPTISVVSATLNQVRFLARLLDSVAEQDYPNLEVIVADGSSSDGTVELLEARARQGVVTRWVSEPDAGQTDGLNKGFAMATGRIRTILDCDERYQPGALKLVGQAFASDPDLDIVFGHRIVVDLEGRELMRMKLPAIHPAKYAIYASGLLFTDTTFWTDEMHQRTGILDQVNYPRYAHDFDWLARLSLHVRRWKRIDAYLSEFTEYEGRVSKNVHHMRDLARDIRLRVLKLAGIARWQVACLSPFYLAWSRYGRFGWKGLLHIPSPASVLRVAGYIR